MWDERLLLSIPDRPFVWRSCDGWLELVLWRTCPFRPRPSLWSVLFSKAWLRADSDAGKQGEKTLDLYEEQPGRVRKQKQIGPAK